VEEVDEHAFLFREEDGADTHHFAIGVARVDEDLLGVLGRPKRPDQLPGVGCFLVDHLLDS
jgi:hypothetical protein